MRHVRATAIILTFSLALAAPSGMAWADAGSGDTSAPVTETKPPKDTSTKPPTDTSTKPPVDTGTKPVTETPATKPPTCESTSSCDAPSTPEVPATPDVPVTPDVNVPTTPDVTPKVPDTPNRIPDTPATTPGAGTQLPFTGPGDVVLAIVLALLAGSGGLLFLLGASGREQLDTLGRRNMDSPSGFQLAYRELRKQQMND